MKPYLPCRALGLKNGDVIASINGRTILFYKDGSTQELTDHLRAFDMEARKVA